MASSAKPVDSLAALDSDGSPRHLVVDALNLLGSYFLADDHGASKGDAWTMLAVMRRRVAGFLEACASTTPTLMPHFVIDAGWQSEEAATKWRKRREKEVRARRRDIPLSADTFLADALRAAGARVYQVEGEDGDDIVAVLARALGETSLILSADRDMFRYDDAVLPDAPRRVAASFSFAEVSAGEKPAGKAKREPAPESLRFGVALHASPTKQPKEGVARRGAGDVPRFDPAKDFERWSAPYDKLKTVVDDPRRGYVRGACSPQTRAFGNLHGHSRPLRLAAYRLMGAEGRVRERFPEWDAANDDVRWEDADVDVESGAVVATSSRVRGTNAENASENAPALDADSASDDLVAETKEAEAFLRDADATCAAHVSALRWLRARDPAWRIASERGEDDTNSFRGFARFAVVAECFTAARRSQDTNASVLATALAMRDRADAETASAAATRADGRGTSGKADRKEKARDVDALFPFPPASHRSSRCAACRARFVVSAGERAFLNERGFAPPARCKPCRDARKAARETQNQNRAAVDGARGAVRLRRGAPHAKKSPGPSATSSSPGPSPGTRGVVRPPRTLKAPSAIAPPRADATTAAETAERLAALAVSRGEAGNDA